LLRLIGEIYDAALDVSLWPQVLSKIAKFVGGPSAALYSKSLSGESSEFSYVSGFDPEYVHSYCNTYFRTDPANGSQFLAPPQRR
jgi:hypothetical protein